MPRIEGKQRFVGCAQRLRGSRGNRAKRCDPAPDPIQSNPIRTWIFHLSMILSENRFPLFGIML
jgi:hypothetical protein